MAGCECQACEARRRREPADAIVHPCWGPREPVLGFGAAKVVQHATPTKRAMRRQARRAKK